MDKEIRLCNGEWVYCNGICCNCIYELKVITSPHTTAIKPYYGEDYYDKTNKDIL